MHGFGFFVWRGYLFYTKQAFRKVHFWRESLLGGTQASFLHTDPKGTLLFVWDRAAFVLAVSCDQSGSIAKVWHLYLEALLDPFFFSLMGWFPCQHIRPWLPLNDVYLREGKVTAVLLWLLLYWEVCTTSGTWDERCLGSFRKLRERQVCGWEGKKCAYCSHPSSTLVRYISSVLCQSSV